jgi:putative ABC transport system substrate-binding protein
MDRRGFARLAALGLLAPLASRGQTPAKPRRIGFLSLDVAAMEYEEPLRQLGWVEGKTIVVERRLEPKSSGHVELMPAAAEELVRLEVELIITDGTDAALAAKNATKSIPIVMAAVGDPVAVGIVSNLAHPGGNITGYSMITTDIAIKRASLVHELLPSARRVGLLVDPSSRILSIMREKSEAAYRALGVTLVPIEPIGGSDEATLAEVARRQIEVFELPLDAPREQAAAVMEVARRHRLAIIAGGRNFLEAGALMTLANNVDDQGRRVAAQIDRILRGANPGDIPIEQPTRFELGINLKTAQALGVAVPKSLLLRADQVIR